MLPLKKNHFSRLKNILVAISATIVACYLFLDAIEQNLHLYLTPSELISKKDSIDFSKSLRLGGLVKKDSLNRNNQNITFKLTDQYNTDIKVTYQGSLPSLFSEGQGAVIDGYWDNNIFHASRVLVKHDENYSPPKVTDDNNIN